MKHIGKLALLGAVIAVSAPFASATILTPGSAPLAPASTAASSYNTGTIVGTASGTIAPGTFSASWSETVYKNTSFDPTGLAFVFTYTNNSGDPLAHSSEGVFLGFNVDAYFVTGSGLAPLSVSESSAGVVDWVYIPNLSPGMSSTVVLFTNATATKPGTFTLSDGSTGFQADLAPAVAPEPSSLMLLGTGLVGAAGAFFRRRATV